MKNERNPGGFSFTFVTPKWVFENLTVPDLRILDVRPDVHEYFKGHVPGAVYVSDAAFRFPLEGLPVQAHAPDLLARFFSKLGLRKTDRVLIYSDFDNVLGATLVAYLLNKSGFEQAMVLDGGFTAYKLHFPVAQEYPRYFETRLPVFEDTRLFVTLEDVKKALRAKNVTFIDARPKNAYLGDVKTWLRNGHIPGAFSLDWHLLMDPVNPHQLQPKAEIEKIFARFHLKKDQPIILYCGTGREASLEFLLMRYLFGFTDVRLYEGSWTEYCTHVELPVETTEMVAAK
jgi:thiosulfate/3-mercaptopyruvate sulfurtransferase